MQENWVREELASEQTLLAAERTFSAWIRAGLAVARTLIFKSYAHQEVARVIGGRLAIWGASIFVYAIISHRPPPLAAA